MQSIVVFLSMLSLSVAWGQSPVSSSSETLALLDQLSSSRSDLTAYGLSRSQQVDLNLSMGLGFHCGQFDPALSIKNTLNEFGHGVQNVANDVVSKATAAIISFPMYKLAQANPKLYNLLNHNFIAAQQQFAMDMKTCHQMESEALNGENPYLGWMQISRQNSMAKAQNKNGEKDLQAALHQVDRQDGREGVPWIISSEKNHERVAAGGMNQPPIWILRDVTKAGFQSLYAADRPHTGSLWSSDSQASDWVVNVVGDQMITTCKGCPKGSKNPRGLYYEIEEGKQRILLDLSERLNHFNSGNFTDHALSEESYYEMTPHMLESVKHFDINNQYKILESLSEHMAIKQAIKKALMAKRLLKAGSYFPEAIAVPEVQRQVFLALSFLDSEVNDVMRSFEIKNKLFNTQVQDLLSLDRSLMGQSITPEVLDHQSLVK